MVFGMQRANGDWYAVFQGSGYWVPIFATSTAAMTARSQDSRMECFRAVEISERALQHLITTHENPGFRLITDPLRNLKRGQVLDPDQLTRLVRNHRAVTQS